LSTLLDVLRWQFRMTWSLGAEVHFPALTDENCLWLPTPDAWTVRRDKTGVWRADWADQEPDPSWLNLVHTSAAASAANPCRSMQSMLLLAVRADGAAFALVDRRVTPQHPTHLACRDTLGHRKRDPGPANGLRS
jgi:hypothetical protein